MTKTVLKGHKIHTEFVKPPIPTTAFDWCAILDGYEPGDPSGAGSTEIEAIADLLQQIEDASQ